MDIFGKLFDFDHDGEVSSSEAMMGLGGAALIAGMAEEQERAQREQELRDRLETLVDEINAHSDESGFHVELEDSWKVPTVKLSRRCWRLSRHFWKKSRNRSRRTCPAMPMTSGKRSTMTCWPRLTKLKSGWTKWTTNHQAMGDYK